MVYCGSLSRVKHSALFEERYGDAQNLSSDDAENSVVMESPCFVTIIQRFHRLFGERAKGGEEQSFPQGRRAALRYRSVRPFLAAGLLHRRVESGIGDKADRMVMARKGVRPGIESRYFTS